jgi:hypothetical protein
MKKANYILAGLLISLALFFFYVSFFFQEALVEDNQLGETFFPRLLAILLTALCLRLIYTTFREAPVPLQTSGKTFLKKATLPFCVVFLLCLYLVFLERAGFLISTVILNFLLLFLFKVRNIFALILFPMGMTGFTYWIFVKLLLVSLPEGLFYF